MDIEKKNIFQAVVIMDTFNNNFNPISNNKPVGLLRVAGVPLIDHVLYSLASGGVSETILFCCQHGHTIKDYIRKCIENKAPWTRKMEIQVMVSDTCRTMGDVMREIDASAIIRGHFVLTGINTITNIPFASLLKQHIKRCKKDKGAAMTLIYKKIAWEHPLISPNKPIFLAADGTTNKILVHRKYKTKSLDKFVSSPLDVVLSHSKVNMHHNLEDPNIALCSPSVLPLFSDNFDFQTRDDFVHGILINEEILASTLYCTLLKRNYYAACVTNWKTYLTICQDILKGYVLPISYTLGTHYRNNYVFMNKNNIVNRSSTLSRSCSLDQNVLVQANTHISDDTKVSQSIIGENCLIGKNVTITGSHIMNNVIIKDNCNIINSFIDDECVIGEDSVLENGTILASKVSVKAGSELRGDIMENLEDIENEKTLAKSTSESGTEWDNESSGPEDDEFIGLEKTWEDSESCYSSDSSSETLPSSPVPDDVNIFLQEVIDSLARGYEKKLMCDYLILEINSSRYAYNIQLHEVNFFVVRALLSIPILTETKNVLSTIKDIFKFAKPILSNYIKSKSSIMDCLRAVEDSCIKYEWLNGRAGQIIHLLYEDDVVDEDSLLEWHKELVVTESLIVNQPTLVKFFEWLQAASEASDESD